MPTTPIEQILMALYILLAVAALMLLQQFGRDRKPEATAQYQPPAGLNPAELGYVLDGFVSYRDVLSLLLYWAEKGFLKIIEEDGFYRLAKLDNLDNAARPYEQYLFSEIFCGRDTVDAEDMACNFRPVLNKARRMVRNHIEQERPIFTAASKALMPTMSFLTAVPVLSALVLSLYRGMGGIAASLIATAILGVVLLNPALGIIHLLRRWRGDPPQTRKQSLAHLLTLYVIVIIGFLLYSWDVTLSILPYIAVASTTIIGLCAAFISKRTEEGYDMLCRAEGLKAHIEGALPATLEALVKEDIQYFYRILPYAYIYGLSGQWARNFNTINVIAPMWFSGYKKAKEFFPTSFADKLTQAMNVLSLYMTVMSGKQSGTIVAHGMPDK